MVSVLCCTVASDPRRSSYAAEVAETLPSKRASRADIDSQRFSSSSVRPLRAASYTDIRLPATSRSLVSTYAVTCCR